MKVSKGQTVCFGRKILKAGDTIPEDIVERMNKGKDSPKPKPKAGSKNSDK